MSDSIIKSAVISQDGKYRYWLLRQWGSGDRVVFLMMNPSTADASVDDHTIRKCMGFAREWGYDGIEVVNLCALRSTDPNAVMVADDPFGPENSRHILETLYSKNFVVCAWGCEGTLRRGRLTGKVKAILGDIKLKRPDIEFKCLGKTKGGTPRHPLMLSYETSLEEL